MRTLDNLKQAQKQLQRVQSSIGAAKSFNALTGSERKILDKVKLGLFDPYDNIQSVIDAINIQLK